MRFTIKVEHKPFQLIETGSLAQEVPSAFPICQPDTVMFKRKERERDSEREVNSSR